MDRADRFDALEAELERKRQAELQARLEAAQSPEERRYILALYNASDVILKRGWLSEDMKQELFSATAAYHGPSAGSGCDPGHDGTPGPPGPSSRDHQ